MNKKQRGSDDAESKSFEFHLQQLEKIVQQLEAGQMDLSESLQVFENGLQHLRHCHQRLHEAEERIALVVEVADDGTARLKEFDASSPSAGEKPRTSKRNPKDADRLF
jgi:exodeoxyribonuclease VII small subunit